MIDLAYLSRILCISHPLEPRAWVLQCNFAWLAAADATVPPTSAVSMSACQHGSIVRWLGVRVQGADIAQL